MSAENIASVVAAIGATGSGKSAWIKQGLKGAPAARQLIWDPQGEYGEFGEVFTDRVKLVDACSRRNARFSLVYRPGDQVSTYALKFDWLCQLAYLLGDLRLVVEELADVTEPSRAPDSWSVVTRKGRHKKLRVIAASQRPANVDKDFFGNCTLVHCGRLNHAADAKVMAGVLNVPHDQIMNLAPLEFIERNMHSGESRREVLKIGV